MRKRDTWRVLSIAAVALMGVTSIGLAGDPSPSDCDKYLQYSDDQFNAQLSNQSTSAAIAETLGACQVANMCSDIADVDNCAATLATREFVSNYYANYTPTADHASRGRRSGAGAPTPAPQKRSAILAPSISAPANNDNQAEAPKKSTSNNIHWF